MFTDRDHIGGTIDLLENIKVKKILDNGEDSDSDIYKKIKAYIHVKNVPIEHLTDKKEINIDKDLKIKAIKPSDIYKNTTNDTSVILHLHYNNFSALLMGDAGYESLDSIKQYIKHPINIIKVGHHGSSNSINKEFLDYLKPQTAIISVGKNNYSHPNRKILNILKDFNIKTLRTDQDHAIEIGTNGKNTKIHSYKDF